MYVLVVRHVSYLITSTTGMIVLVLINLLPYKNDMLLYPPALIALEVPGLCGVQFRPQMKDSAMHVIPGYLLYGAACSYMWMSG